MSRTGRSTTKQAPRRRPARSAAKAARQAETRARHARRGAELPRLAVERATLQANLRAERKVQRLTKQLKRAIGTSDTALLGFKLFLEGRDNVVADRVLEADRRAGRKKTYRGSQKETAAAFARGVEQSAAGDGGAIDAARPAPDEAYERV